MTETWASMCRDVAAFVDVAENKTTAQRFRRLASLLEQITPEMVETVSDIVATYELDYTDGLPDCESCRIVADEARRARHGLDILRALSTAPTEETEDR